MTSQENIAAFGPVKWHTEVVKNSYLPTLGISDLCSDVAGDLEPDWVEQINVRFSMFFYQLIKKERKERT